MAQIILFHDGCNICLDISRTMASSFNTPEHAFESIDLSIQKTQLGMAHAIGVTRLPSLVIDGKVMRLDDHSSIEHVV